ncbi:MAG: insulinase family protein [Bacteroidales bacterium]|nr:insulinase family protein [Bacteroidales bacterium]
MLQPPSLQPLVPQQYRLTNGNTVYYFTNESLQLVKLDFTFEAGSAYQQLKSQAHAANQLMAEATLYHTAQEIADFMDFRGIVIERMADVTQGNISVYFLRKYAAELLPLLNEMFSAPLVTAQLFDAYISRRRLKIAQGFQQTNYVARNHYYELLFGPQSPMGTYAKPGDLDQLTLESVRQFIARHYTLAHAHIVLSGLVDTALLDMVNQHLGQAVDSNPITPYAHQGYQTFEQPCRKHVVVPNAVQSTLRIGNLLSMPWNSAEYAQFMVLNTVLGGYFGSRLMSNLREDKGYTYGVYSQTQVFRGAIVFYITADVAAQATQPAVDEVLHEVRRLQTELIPDVELDRVRNFMMGDFIRSIDGTFEISERYRQMVANSINDQFAVNYLQAVQQVTPQQLQQLAQRHLSSLFVVTAGPEEV